MATKKWLNITSFVHDAVTYTGIRSFEVTVNAGTYEPNHAEGTLYPEGADNVGTQDQFPVLINIETEDQSTLLDLMTAGVGDTVLTGTPAGANTAEKVTIVNAIYHEARQRQGRGAGGRSTHTGFAYSADGDALPIAITDVA